MSSEFDTKLKHINGHMPFCKVPKKCTCGADDRNEQIKTLVADTVLKAMPEPEKKLVGYSFSDPVIGAAYQGYNQAINEIKAKVFEELGIKEK